MFHFDVNITIKKVNEKTCLLPHPSMEISIHPEEIAEKNGSMNNISSCLLQAGRRLNLGRQEIDKRMVDRVEKNNSTIQNKRTSHLGFPLNHGTSLPKQPPHFQGYNHNGLSVGLDERIAQK